MSGPFYRMVSYRTFSLRTRPYVWPRFGTRHIKLYCLDISLAVYAFLSLLSLSSTNMRYLFFLPPASGEVNPILTIAEALLVQDEKAQIYLATGPSIEQLLSRSSLSVALATSLHCIVLHHTHQTGEPIAARDYTCSHPRGNPVPLYLHCEKLGLNMLEGMVAIAEASKQVVYDIKPDIIMVNGGSSCAFDGMSQSQWVHLPGRHA